jgi:hypothetical protein
MLRRFPDLKILAREKCLFKREIELTPWLLGSLASPAYRSLTNVLPYYSETCSTVFFLERNKLKFKTGNIKYCSYLVDITQSRPLFWLFFSGGRKRHYGCQI